VTGLGNRSRMFTARDLPVAIPSFAAIFWTTIRTRVLKVTPTGGCSRTPTPLPDSWPSCRIYEADGHKKPAPGSSGFFSTFFSGHDASLGRAVRKYALSIAQGRGSGKPHRLYPIPGAGLLPGHGNFSAADAAFFSDLARETHFYLIRHGERAKPTRSASSRGIPIIPHPPGEAQAAAAGRWLSGKGVTHLACSPCPGPSLRRDPGPEAGIPAPVPDPLFMELDTGCFSDCPGEAQEKYPEATRIFVPGAGKRCPERRASKPWRAGRIRLAISEGPGRGSEGAVARNPRGIPAVACTGDLRMPD
jgi:hypothetical protein